MKRPLILITNDDGIEARGIHSLVDAVRHLGDVVVVAPDGPRSAQSSAITVNTHLRFWKHQEKDGLVMYRCNGTPCDCVKLALYTILDRQPDIILAGINHGTNAAINVLYSGTMGAVFEGCTEGIPAVGFSLDSHDPRADFSEAVKYAVAITQKVLTEGLPKDICLNVNIPLGENLKGMRVCRQCYGRWNERFVCRQDPGGNNYYWLTGEFINLEPDATDTDQYAMDHGYVAIVPCQVDFTHYSSVQQLSHWNEEIK
jgi:5'-nucleotidase